MRRSRQIDGQGGQQGEPGHREKNAGWKGAGEVVEGRGGEGGGTERRERRRRAETAREGGGGGIKMGVHANFIILLINFSSSNPPAGT